VHSGRRDCRAGRPLLRGSRRGNLLASRHRGRASSLTSGSTTPLDRVGRRRDRSLFAGSGRERAARETRNLDPAHHGTARHRRISRRGWPTARSTTPERPHPARRRSFHADPRLTTGPRGRGRFCRGVAIAPASRRTAPRSLYTRLAAGSAAAGHALLRAARVSAAIPARVAAACSHHPAAAPGALLGVLERVEQRRLARRGGFDRHGCVRRLALQCGIRLR
jgi:hypothetical protein